MPQTITNGPLCGNEAHRVIDRRISFGQPVVNSACLRCGFVFQPSQMSAEELERFYQGQYRQLYQGDGAPTQANLANQEQRAGHLAAWIKPEIRSVAAHLDIGCSTGILLKKFQESYHCQPAGIEPGTAFREYARRSGLQVYATLTELEQEREGRFDLVSMIHVLEHISDPVGYLVHLRERLISPAGWLLIEVPNLYAHDSFEIAHLVSFSPHTLSQALKKAGFDIRLLKRHGYPRSRLFPLYITLLAQPSPTASPEPVSSERLVPLKRKTAMLARRVMARLFPRLAWIPEKE